MFKIIISSMLLIWIESVQMCRLPKIRSLRLKNAVIPNQVFCKDKVTPGSNIGLLWWQCHNFKKNIRNDESNKKKDFLNQQLQLESDHYNAPRPTRAEKRKKDNQLEEEFLWSSDEGFNRRSSSPSQQHFTIAPTTNFDQYFSKNKHTKWPIFESELKLNEAHEHTKKKRNPLSPTLLYVKIRDIIRDSR